MRTRARLRKGGCQQDLHKIFSYRPVLKYKIMLGPLTRIHQDLHNIFSQGPLQDLGQDLHKSLGPPRVNHETLARSSYKGPRAGQPFCASLRSRHADGHVRRAILREKLQEKCRARDSDAQFV